MLHGADLALAKRYMSTRENAKKRKIPFDLSLKKAAELLSETRCAVTGKLFTSKGGMDATSLSFERIDASVGYVDDNVIAVTNKVNSFKGSTLDLFVKDDNKVLTDEEKIKLLRKVLYRIEKRVKAKQKPPVYKGAQRVTINDSAVERYRKRFGEHLLR